MEKNPEPNPNPKKKLLTDYVRYSALGLQMLVIIGLGCYGGWKLDEYLGLKYPIFTMLGVLLSLFLSLYYLVKDLSRKR